jgi:hypothetical protein
MLLRIRLMLLLRCHAALRRRMALLGLWGHTLRRYGGPLLRRLLTLLSGAVGLVLRLLHSIQMLLL